MITLTTHWVDYTPENVGQDWVVSACGRLVHVKQYSNTPNCSDPRCKEQAALFHLDMCRHRLQRARDARG